MVNDNAKPDEQHHGETRPPLLPHAIGSISVENIYCANGVYIANILSETKRWPYTVVRRVYRTDDVAAAGPDIIRVPGPGQRLDPSARQ